MVMAILEPGSANDNCGGLSDLSAGDLIIRAYAHYKTVDYERKWFEIYGNTSSNINLNGLVIGGSGSDPETVSTTYIFRLVDMLFLRCVLAPSITVGWPM